MAGLKGSESGRQMAFAYAEVTRFAQVSDAQFGRLSGVPMGPRSRCMKRRFEVCQRAGPKALNCPCGERGRAGGLQLCSKALRCLPGFHSNGQEETRQAQGETQRQAS
jgi:hypothetical protein